MQSSTNSSEYAFFSSYKAAMPHKDIAYVLYYWKLLLQTQIFLRWDQKNVYNLLQWKLFLYMIGPSWDRLSFMTMKIKTL